MQLRVMTYNVHSCIGVDRKLSLQRIVDVISAYEPDIVALQELDVARKRSAHVDQAHAIAKQLGMAYHFHPTIKVAEERYGDAVLTHLPMRLVRAGELPGLEVRRPPEPRGAIWVRIDAGGATIQCLNTHLGLRSRERRLQVASLLGAQWLAHPECIDPVIFCGDFNAIPSSPVCRALRARLRDVQLDLGNHKPSSTWWSRYPFLRIDHVFVSKGVEIVKARVPRTRLARTASDHLPLVVDLAL